MPIPRQHFPINLNPATPTPVTVENLKKQLTDIGLTCPDSDPEKLKAYAERFNADAGRWHFLTGTVEQMRDAAAGMKVAAAKATDGSDQYIHSEKFFLVDADGVVRGAYSSNDEAELTQLAHDAAALARTAAPIPAGAAGK